jgi:TolA-binding protein
LRRISVGAAVVAAATTWAAATSPADAPAAEAQYRLAQRLAADGSPGAIPAFEKVVALAPDGPLADDALIGMARLQGAADWPEDLARLDAAHARAASASLAKILELHPQGDRVTEARYLHGLLSLAPLAGRDAGQAKEALITVATADGGEPWRAKARYALGYLAETEGAIERAAGAYARLVVESPKSDAATRGRVGFARAALQQERFGDAAVSFQSATESDAPASLRAAALRELAVREIVQAREPARAWSAAASVLPATPTTRGASLLATGDGGALVVFDRKNAAIQLFDVRGAGRAPMPQEGVTALATDAAARVYVAAGDKLLRWDGAAWTPLGALGAFAGATAIAVDAAGNVWLADRRGDRIARWAPGAEAPVVVRESKGADVSALAAAPGRVIAAEAKTGKLVQIAASGASAPFGPAFRRPEALTIDAAGRLSILDTKAQTLTRLSPSGEVRDTLNLAAVGLDRAIAVAATDEGSVRILDGATGSVAVAP